MKGKPSTWSYPREISAISWPGISLSAWVFPSASSICASNNTNKVLADFFETGVYDMNRTVLYDELVRPWIYLLSSNFERFLFYVAGGDSSPGCCLGKGFAGNRPHGCVTRTGAGGFAGKISAAAGSTMKKRKRSSTMCTMISAYLLDPHTAVRLWRLSESAQKGGQGQPSYGHHVDGSSVSNSRQSFVDALALGKGRMIPYAMLAQLLATARACQLPKPLAELTNVRTGALWRTASNKRNDDEAGCS
jgi:threonine synthase